MRIEAIRAGREEELAEDEQLPAAFIRQVVSRSVKDETWDSMEKRYGNRRAVSEYAIFIAFLQLILTLSRAFGIPEDTGEAVQDVIDRFKAGEPIGDHLPMTM